VTLYDNSGTEVSELSQCVYIKIFSFIFPRDVATNFRSKRGAGDFYALDAVWFMFTHREGSYGEYMQEARKNGVGIVSLVDRKDLLAYLEEDLRPEECQYVDTSAPLPVPRRSFTNDEEPEGKGWEEEPTAPLQVVPSKKVKARPARAKDAVFASGKDFTLVLNVAKETFKDLEEPTGNPPPTSKHSVSLIEQIASANKPQIPVKRSEPETGRNFSPIIVVPAAPTAVLTMYNVQQFLEGKFIPTTKIKAAGISKQNSLLFEHKLAGRQMKIQIIDNPTRLSSEDWRRVAAVFVQGNTWQFKGWKWESPVELFQHARGFSLEFEDTKPSPNISNWNVHCLTINRSRRHLDSTAAFQFWERLEEFLKTRRML
jgi:parafibromin